MDIKKSYELAKSIRNKSSVEKKRKIVEYIRQIYENNKNNTKIKENYTLGLANLTVYTKIEEKRKLAENIEKIYKDNKDNKKIKENYTLSLANLTAGTEIEERRKLVKDIRKIYEENKDNEEIKENYTLGLANLTEVKDVEERRKLVEDIRKIYEENKGNKEIKENYTLGLANLTADTEIEERRRLVKDIRKMYEDNKDNTKIKEYYTLGLSNLTSDTNMEKIKKVVDDIKKLYEDNKDNTKIKENYTFALANLTASSDTDERKKLLEELEDIYNKDKENNKIKRMYIGVLFNPTEKPKKLKDIENLMKKSIELLNVNENLFANTEYEIVGNLIKKYKEDIDKLSKIYFIWIKTKCIMNELLVKEIDMDLCHYTKLDYLKNFIKKKNESYKIDKIKLRLTNTNYMNDPEEGTVLLKYLEKLQENKNINIKEIIYDLNNKFKVSNVYSFSMMSNKDDLPMWRQYGSNGEGCCILFNENIFDKSGNIFENDINIKEQKSNNNGLNEKPYYENCTKEKYYLYKICYLNKNKENENEKINECLEQILDCINSIVEKFEKNKEEFDMLKEDIIDCIDQIRYLFKSDVYEYEKEVRIIKRVPLDSEKILFTQENIPKLYIEIDDRDIKIDEIVLGPKVENPDFITPYVKYCDEHIKVSKSQIKYR